jgi:dihydroorotate dehydrogenase
VTPVERAALAVLHRLDPERAHNLSLLALRAGLVPLPGAVTSARLVTQLAGMTLPNPVGLAAGYDKNAVALGPLTRAGFGFIEVGATTPRAQDGNPAPRLWRLPQDRGVINRFGFNNRGMQAMWARLAARAPGPVPVGLNLGANKDSTDRAGDFAAVLAHCGPQVDFATVNVSSPNTERLRDLQGPAALTALLERVMEVRASLTRPIPVFLKVAPDLDDDAIGHIAEAATAAGLAGIIATNTTLARDGLQSRDRDKTGGLSGQPLFERSTRVLAKLHRATGGKMPLIGVGGVASAEQAWQKIRAGATAVQLYSGLVYGGLSLVGDIARGLDTLAEQAGLARVQDGTGSGTSDWL